MPGFRAKKLRAPSWVMLLCVPLFSSGPSVARSAFADVMALKPDVAHGQELFQACAACHGADGGGTTAGTTPRIAGQHYRVLVRQLVDYRSGRRWDALMEDVATSHEFIPEKQDIADVAWYVSRLERGGEHGVRDGVDTERGAAIYAANCRSCHGAEAEGDGNRGIPRLAGQHAGYLSRQIYDAVDGRRPPLTASHAKRFAGFNFQEVMGLTDYLARLGWQGVDPPGNSASATPAP